MVRGIGPREDVVAVVASGPSLKGFDYELLADIPTIAVNHALMDFHRCRNPPKYWMTVNPERTEEMMDLKVEGVTYFAGVPTGWSRRWKPWVHRMRRIGFVGLSDRWDTIITGNSGYAGLGLAYLMHPKKILLLGIDGGDAQGEHVDRWGRTKSLAHLPTLFSSARKQLKQRGIEVVNGSPDSRVTCFPRTTPQGGLDWLTS